MKNSVTKHIPSMLLAVAIIVYIFLRNHPSNIATPILILLAGLIKFARYIGNRNTDNDEGSTKSLMVSILFFTMSILLFID